MQLVYITVTCLLKDILLMNVQHDYPVPYTYLHPTMVEASYKCYWN